MKYLRTHIVPLCIGIVIGVISMKVIDVIKDVVISKMLIEKEEQQ